jgi:hypothetical protein
MDVTLGEFIDGADKNRPHYFQGPKYATTQRDPCDLCGKLEDDDIHTPF